MAKKAKLVEGGWMDFLLRVRNSYERELTDGQVKDMMKLYISGVSVEEALKSLWGDYNE